MAEISATRDHDPYGELEYRVDWEENDGSTRKRFFKSRRSAEQFAVEIEVLLLGQAVETSKPRCVPRHPSAYEGTPSSADRQCAARR